MKCKWRQRCRNRGSDATLLVLENKRRSGGGSEWIWNQRKRENMRCYTPECFKASFWRHRLIFIRTEMLCSVKSYLLSCFTNKTFLKLFWWFLSTTAPTVSLLFVYRGNKDGALGAAYWQECQLACVSVHDQAWENELRARLRGLLVNMGLESQGQRSCSSGRTAEGRRRRMMVLYTHLSLFSLMVSGCTNTALSICLKDRVVQFTSFLFASQKICV